MPSEYDMHIRPMAHNSSDWAWFNANAEPLWKFQFQCDTWTWDLPSDIFCSLSSFKKAPFLSWCLGYYHTHTPTHHVLFMNRGTENILHEQTSRWSENHSYWHLPGLPNALALMWQWYLAPSRTPNLQRCRWGGGVLTACTRQTSVELEHLPSWPSHVQPMCTIHSPPVAEYSSSYANNNPNTWVKNAKIQIT